MENTQTFTQWYESQKRSVQVAVGEFFEETCGYSRMTIYRYTAGVTPISSLLPAIKDLMVEKFPELKSILFPEKEVVE
jgi:hypothetical protein